MITTVSQNLGKYFTLMAVVCDVKCSKHGDKNKKKLKCDVWTILPKNLREANTEELTVEVAAITTATNEERT